ncbi:hypothetical protein FGF1_36180 [Flavobacteriaceae bacterium GF1]
MKKFILLLLKFSTALVGVVTFLVIISALIGRSLFPFQIQEDKNILILGNSHPECAINDNEIDGVINLAQSGTAYFYDYLKLREFVNKNHHIDTVILGYTYSDLKKEMDEWVTGEDKLKFKIRDYFILFNSKDYFALAFSNPVGVITNTPQTIFYNLNAGIKGLPHMGGFKYLERNKLKEAKERLKKQNTNETPFKISNYQGKYLKKIYAFCKERNITLILLSTPLHPMEVEYQKEMLQSYNNFASKNLPEALLINHSNFQLPESYYADLDHLNHKGARLYTQYLKTNYFDR